MNERLRTKGQRTLSANLCLGDSDLSDGDSPPLLDGAEQDCDPSPDPLLLIVMFDFQLL